MMPFTIASSAVLSGTDRANAATTIDIQRYGDKELKIAAINKIKQLLRNELIQNPKGASDWIKLAISDAVSYNAATDAGGPDASIQYDDALLSKNQGLKKALATCKAIRKQTLKTTEVTLADVIAYAGAEAIEASGGPRIQVQIGRYDAGKMAPDANPHLSWAEGDLSSAIAASGLGVKDAVVLLAAIENVDKASEAAEGGKAVARVDPDDDDDELFPADGGIFIPQTFGSQKAMFGELLTKAPFDATVFKDSKGALASLIQKDAAAKSLANKYASKNGDLLFRSDLAATYVKLTIVGASLTGAKVLAP